MKTKQLLIIFCCLTWFISCSSDDDCAGNGNEGCVPVSFTADTCNIALLDNPGEDSSPGLRTVADGSKWILGDEIGIFMLNSGAAGISGNIADGADNKQFKAINSGSFISFIPFADNQVIYFPPDRNVSFISYYPYKANLNNYIYPVDIRTQTDPAGIDMLYCPQTPEYNKYTSNIILPFKHKLCRIVLNLSNGGSGMDVSDFQNLLGSNVIFTGFTVTADINLSNGVVIPSTDRSKKFSPIKSSSPPPGYVAQFTAIIIPDEAVSGRRITFDFTSKGKAYTFNIPGQHSFQSGDEWTYSLSFLPKTRRTALKSGSNEVIEAEVVSVTRQEWR